MAESITYDFISRGADKLAGDFRKTGDTAAAAARGAKVLADVIKDLGQKSDRTAGESVTLARALRLTGDAEDRAAAKALAADAAIRRLNDAMQETAKKPLIPQVQTAKALKALAGIQVRADELKARFPDFTVKIDDAAAKARLALFAAEAKVTLDKIDRGIAGAGSGRGILSRLGGLFGGGSGGGGGSGAAGGAGTGLPGGAAATTFGSNPYVLAGAGAAVAAAAPFAGQIAGAGIVGVFGAALAGLGIAGASSAKSVEASFARLKTSATADLHQIGTAFVPVMNSVYGTATSVLGKLTPVFAGAERVIAGPFRDFADGVLKAFNQPAVKASIDAVAKSFGAILKAVTPGLAGDVGGLANGITKIAQAVAANPKAIAAFVTGLFKIGEGALYGIAALTRTANYIEAHFGPAMHRTAVIFDGVRHDIAHIWDQIFENSAGTVIRLAHNVETQFNSFQHATANIFDGIRGGIHRAWNLVWADSIGAVIHGTGVVVSWFHGLPGRITGALGSAGNVLLNWGAGVIKGLLSGMSSVIGSVWNFIKGIPGKILSFLGIHSPPQWAIDAGKHIMNGLGIGMSQAQGKAKAATASFRNSVAGQVAGNFGAGVPGTSGSVVSWIQAALRATGEPSSWLGALEVLVSRESGGNPRAVNPISVMGEHASGLFQTLPSTYAQFATVAGGVFNPIADAVAGIRYLAATYGSPFNIPGLLSGHYAGYDQGGYLQPGLTLAYNGTGRPEQVIPAGRGGSSGGGGDTHLHLHNNGVIGSQAELQSWFERSFSALAYTGKARRILKQTGGT